jgi:hypothetical protein
MLLHHLRNWIPAAAVAISFHCQSASANPVAAPVPDNAKIITGTPQTPGRVAALKKWNEAKFGLFLHWGVYAVYGGTYKGRNMWDFLKKSAQILRRKNHAAARKFAAGA